MLVFCGRLLMVLLWGFLLWNVLFPYPRPLNIFVNVALLLTVLLHGLQLLLFKATQVAVIQDKASQDKVSRDSSPQPLSVAAQWRFFLFGVFEVLAVQRQQKVQRRKSEAQAAQERRIQE